MAYAVKAGEPIEKSVRRIAGVVLRRAMRDLAESEPAVAHHRIRKGCKKMRALLRLVRGPLGDVFAEENAWYRDFARSLAGVRDAQVVVEFWRKLTENGCDDLPVAQRALVLDALEMRRDRLAAGAAPTPGDLHGQLDLALRRAHQWQLNEDGFEAIAGGLRRAYSRARSAQRRARSQPTPDVLHQWRKRAKDHWYHMRLLDCVWPEEFRARTRALGRLTENLGEHHDLDVLRAVLQELAVDAATLRIVNRHIDQQAHPLAGAAIDRGSQLFAERAKPFVKRMRVHHQLFHDAAVE